MATHITYDRIAPLDATCAPRPHAEDEEWVSKAWVSVCTDSW
jgi:hypothetical protein